MDEECSLTPLASICTDEMHLLTELPNVHDVVLVL